jgi:hypothetical protein
MAYRDNVRDEMRNQLRYLVQIKENMRDLDERIRGVSLFLAFEDLNERHADISEWEINDRPDEAMIVGKKEERPVVVGRVRTMSLHGKGSLGGRQQDSMRKNLEDLARKEGEFLYMFLLDPWTVDVVREQFSTAEVSVLPLMKEDMAAVIRKPAPGEQMPPSAYAEPISQMVEEVITKDAEIPDERTVVSPISRTSIRQGFLYIPKDKGELIEPGPVKVWIRKDASLDSKCMVSQTGGVRIGGGLTKWFRSLGLQPDDELVMGITDESNLLVLMVRRKNPRM